MTTPNSGVEHQEGYHTFLPWDPVLDMMQNSMAPGIPLLARATPSFAPGQAHPGTPRSGEFDSLYNVASTVLGMGPPPAGGVAPGSGYPSTYGSPWQPVFHVLQSDSTR